MESWNSTFRTLCVSCSIMLHRLLKNRTCKTEKTNSVQNVLFPPFSYICYGSRALPFPSPKIGKPWERLRNQPKKTNNKISDAPNGLCSIAASGIDHSELFFDRSKILHLFLHTSDSFCVSATVVYLIYRVVTATYYSLLSNFQLFLLASLRKPTIAYVFCQRRWMWSERIFRVPLFPSAASTERIRGCASTPFLRTSGCHQEEKRRAPGHRGKEEPFENTKCCLRASDVEEKSQSKILGRTSPTRPGRFRVFSEIPETKYKKSQ